MDSHGLHGLTGTCMDLQGLSGTCRDLHGLGGTCRDLQDLQGLAWTCVDFYGLAWTCMDLRGLLSALATFVNQSAAVGLNVKLSNICDVRDNRHGEGRTFVVDVNEITLTRVLPSTMT